MPQQKLKTLIVIPARLRSTRLPNKMLLKETGKPLIQHTYEAASQAELHDEIVVATDDVTILETVKRFGGNVEMTSVEAPSGTDRVAEVSRRHPEFELVVNVQGDEPEISATAIDQAIESLANDPSAVMSTLANRIEEPSKIDDPACVKVVFDQAGNALYFSRSPIPHYRDRQPNDQTDYFQHIGLYCYRRDFLHSISELKPTKLELAEKLEQLRVLENGNKIKVSVVAEGFSGIDTAEDYRAFVKRSGC